LLTDADQGDDKNQDVVKLMTIHAAKGLEFPVVFVGGLEETLFPNAMAINTREELEEERRLFYVAITRAKTKLYLSYSNARYRFGQLQQNDPSRFIDEMPEENLDKSYAGAPARNNGSSAGSRGSAFERMGRGFENTGGSQTGMFAKKEPAKPAYATPARPQTKEHTISDNFVASNTADLAEGQKVEHQKFGFGVIAKMEGAAHNPIATIHFETNGEKKIMLNYAKLMIVSP
jgi:DNA helicase II / ATP-dependent DNA helicase PcrA